MKRNHRPANPRKKGFAGKTTCHRRFIATTFVHWTGDFQLMARIRKKILKQEHERR
jgi:hypothetical protein